MLTLSCQSYDHAYSQTASGTVTIKELPAMKALKTSKASGNYFDNANGLFRTLFRYIRDNNIAMTVPVETRQEPAGMIFFVGKKDQDKALLATASVNVIHLPARTVASAGYRGSYTRANFDKARQQLRDWLKDHPEYQLDGDEFAVYWNSPFVPGFMKKFEVNVPVKKQP